MVLKHLAKEGTCKLSSLWSLCCHNYFFAQQFCDRKRREKNCQRWQRGRSLRNVDGGLRREPLRWAVGPRRVVVLRPPISTEVMGGGVEPRYVSHQPYLLSPNKSFYDKIFYSTPSIER